jgi:hypothetical protein
MTYVAIIIGIITSGCMGPDLEYISETITITNSSISDITTNSAQVTWDTDYDAWSRVQIVAQDSVSNTILNTDLKRNHSMEVKHLLPGHQYMLLLMSSNSRGASSYNVGKDLIFSTLPSEPTTAP